MLHPFTQTPSSLDYFTALVGSDEDFPLLEAVISLAHDEYPDLDIQQVLCDVDQMLQRLKRRVPADATALQRLNLLNHYFFSDLGFGGNYSNYYDPENSFIHCVLRTRRGISLSLAVLWLELAQGIGLHARGVAFPGHFLVKALLPQGQVIIDPFTGRSLSREELAGRLQAYSGMGHVLGEKEPPVHLFLQSSTSREIVARMLRNLKDIYLAQRDWHRLVRLMDRMVVLLPQAWSEHRERGLAHAECGSAAEAIRDLETYLNHAPEREDAALVRARLNELRSLPAQKQQS